MFFRLSFALDALRLLELGYIDCLLRHAAPSLLPEQRSADPVCWPLQQGQGELCGCRICVQL